MSAASDLYLPEMNSRPRPMIQCLACKSSHKSSPDKVFIADNLVLTIHGHAFLVFIPDNVKKLTKNG